MKCPSCQEILFAVEFDEIELDYCGACHGIWLDAGELDLLLENHTLTEGFLSSGNPSVTEGEEARLCPICDSPMHKLVTGGAKPIIHDQCPKGHGIWFDRGELLVIIEEGMETAHEPAIVYWLRDLFRQDQEHT